MAGRHRRPGQTCTDVQGTIRSTDRTHRPLLVDRMSAAPRAARWVPCQQFGNEPEASIAVAILDGSGIPAIIRSNDSVGLFGGTFQGFSHLGVTLLVPDIALEAARTVLALNASE